MNWTRGLLRLWVLVALCWVTSSSFISFDELFAVRDGGRDYSTGSCEEASPKAPLKLSDSDTPLMGSSLPPGFTLDPPPAAPTSGALPPGFSLTESKVFECQQNGKKVTIAGPKGAAVNAVDALEVFHRERPELFTTFVSDWPTRIEAAKWVLLPPLGLLLLGFVVVWAVRGFRP